MSSSSAKQFDIEGKAIILENRSLTTVIGSKAGAIARY